jgi:purine nucleosidase
METHANEAARFIVEQVGLYPGEVTIVGLGPFTNIGLARLMDPSLVTRAHLHIMAGAFASDVSIEHLDQPNHETNLFFDPEMSQAMLRPDDVGQNWLSITVVPVDVCFHAPWTASFDAKLAALRNTTLAAQYIVDCAGGHGIGLCDELAAVLLSNPNLGSVTQLHMDVDISRSGASGDTRSWHAGRPLPPYAVGSVGAYLTFDVQGFYDAFVGLIASSAGPRARPDTQLCVTAPETPAPRTMISEIVGAV